MTLGETRCRPFVRTEQRRADDDGYIFIELPMIGVISGADAGAEGATAATTAV